MLDRAVGRQLSRRGEGEGELEKISELNTTRTIEKLWSDKHAVTVQHRLGTIAVHKDSWQ